MDLGKPVVNDIIRYGLDKQCKRCAGQGSFGFYTFPFGGPYGLGPAVFKRYSCLACDGTGYDKPDAELVPEDAVHEGQV